MIRKFIQLTIFLGWLAGITWTGLVLEKLDMFESLIAGLTR
jgi:hypothetical protein